MYEYHISQISGYLSPPRGRNVLSEGKGYQAEVGQPHGPLHLRTLEGRTIGKPLCGKEGGEFRDEMKVYIYKLDLKRESRVL